MYVWVCVRVLSNRFQKRLPTNDVDRVLYSINSYIWHWNHERGHVMQEQTILWATKEKRAFIQHTDTQASSHLQIGKYALLLTFIKFSSPKKNHLLTMCLFKIVFIHSLALVCCLFFFMLDFLFSTAIKFGFFCCRLAPSLFFGFFYCHEHSDWAV